MDWSTLSILNATTVQKECEMAITLLRKFSDDNSPKLSSFAESVKRRVDELEVFYAANDDDDRAILFERERMKLRKALQSIVGTPIASGQNVGKSFFPATNMSVPNQFNILVTGNSSKVPPSSRLNIDDLNDSKRLSCAHTSPGRQSVHSVAVTDTTSFLLSPRAVAQSKAKAVEPERMTKKPVTRIYDWEDGRRLRGKIQVDDDSFVPTSVAGVYVREDGMDQMPSSEKWIDVKVVLDQDELKTLASRKKALKRVQRMGLASSNFVSVQSSTPYIDQRRIVKETYRPDHPEKWLNPVYHNK